MEETTTTPTSEVTETQVTIPVESTNVEEVSTTEAVSDVNTDAALAAELTRLQESKSKYTEEEKARFTIKKIQERFPNLKEDTTPVDEDDAPVKKSELLQIMRQMQAVTAEKSAMDLAESISNPIDKEMVKFHIEHTIRPSGNAAQDLATAQSLVNAKRNEIALAEQSRRGVVKPAPTGSSAPAKETPVTNLTAEEQMFVTKGILTKEEVLKARGVNAFGTKSLR